MKCHSYFNIIIIYILSWIFQKKNTKYFCYCKSDFITLCNLKFRYSEKATKIWPIFHFLSLLLFQILTKYVSISERWAKFCGLLRISKFISLSSSNNKKPKFHEKLISFCYDFFSIAQN